MPEEFPKNEAPKEDVFFVRHSKSAYKTYAATQKSENPRAPFDSEHQISPDLTEEGVALAKKSAEALLGTLDPLKDELFFVSSNEARALETANVFRAKAHDRGFNVIRPEKSGSATAEQITGGEVRVVENLSLNPKDTLLLTVFNPKNGLRPTNWGGVDEEFKKKWDEARAIIMADDQGSFGENAHKHSEAIKKIFPEVKTTKELHEKQFKNLLRLAQWAEKKFALRDKRIKIVAFGHENYVLQALDQYCQENGINNCETIGLSVGGDAPVLSFRGKQVEIDPESDKDQTTSK